MNGGINQLYYNWNHVGLFYFLNLQIRLIFLTNLIRLKDTYYKCTRKNNNMIAKIIAVFNKLTMLYVTMKYLPTIVIHYTVFIMRKRN